MGPRVRRPKSPYRQKVQAANELWRKLIRAKEPSGVCPRCQKRPWVEAAHCWAKGPHPKLRFDLENGAPLCRPCHTRVDSDHQAKRDFFRAYMGEAEYERLELRARARVKNDLALTLLFLRAEVKRLGLEAA